MLPSRNRISRLYLNDYFPTQLLTRTIIDIINLTDNWDERERSREQDMGLNKRVQLFDKYLPIVIEYARINKIDLPKDDDDDYLNVIYNFVWDARFIDYAYDKCGILFNEQMYTLQITDEDIKELKKSGVEFVSEEELKKIEDEKGL